MRYSIILIAILAFSAQTVISQEKYEPEWKSLLNYKAPEWYEDAKLGFWVHWGVYSVPAFKGGHAAEWYGRWMYCQRGQSSRDNQGLATHIHHNETYGPPEKFGYKDLIPMFRAENFDAEEWAELCVEGGAKFFTMMGAHHDAFCLWDTKLSKWNSVNMGPMRDLVGEMAGAARKKGLKFGVSNHTAWNYTFFQWNHINRYDAVNKEYQDLYGNPIVQPSADTMRMWPGETRNSWEARSRGSVQPSERDLDRWLARTRELADMYKPDLYYFDWGMNPPIFESRRREFAAHYYNKAIEWGNGSFGDPNVVLNYKNRRTFPPGSAVLDFERGANDDIAEMVWQTDDCVYDGHNWGFSEGEPIKPVNRIIDELVEIVSKRGILMLSFAPRADGSFPEDQKTFMREMGAWLKVNGEAIYKTRPWIKAVENSAVGHPEKGQSSDTGGGPGTVRTCFTRSKDNMTLYATMLEWPGTSILIGSVNPEALEGRKIKSVSLVGSKKKVRWDMDENGLKVRLGEEPAYGHAYPLKIRLQ